MKKIIFGLIIFFLSVTLVKAADLTCYYSQDTSIGSNSLYNIIVEVSKDGTIKSYVDSSSPGVPTVDNSHITYKEFLKKNETVLSCPSSLYTELPGLPANTYNIYFQYDQSVFMFDKCDNSAFCFHGTLDKEKSTPDLNVNEGTENSFTCEYNSNGALVGADNARILYSVVDGVPFFSVKGGETKYKIDTVDTFEVAASCEEQGSLYIQCHLGNNECKVANSKEDLTNLVQSKVEITLVSKEDETIKDGDAIEKENESHRPSKEEGFSPDRVCADGNCDINLNNFCGEPTVASVLRFIGLIIFIAKILVPAIIIIIGLVNLFKIMTSGKEDEAKKQVKNIIRNIVIGILIFLLPSLIKMIFKMADNIIEPETPSDFSNCVNCITDPNSCVIKEND